MAGWSLFIAVFLACAVEAVEATTIVLAAGTARNWRSALVGVAAGLVVLAVIVGLAGPAISILPLDGLRLVVGGLLLVFGLQWIRKAVLRASGYKPLHDEDAIFRTQLDAAQTAESGRRGIVSDWYGFTLAFKGVLLEGLEVAFIVLTFGTVQNQVPLASLAAVIAIVAVAMAGFTVRKPLARMPENTMKFVVGIMLTSFGIFWGAEGAGAQWPGADLALLAIVAFVAVVSLALVWSLRGRKTRGAADVPVLVGAHDREHEDSDTAAAATTHPRAPAADTPHPQIDIPRRTVGTRLRAFGLFWYDFIVGDDWQVTAGILVAFVLTFWMSAVGITTWWLVPLAVLLLLPHGIARAIRDR